MSTPSATFVKGIVGPDDALDSDIPQIAFIGRSNVGKSSLINALTHKEGLARTSAFPGRTTEINLFLINKKVYFVDLPGYGYAKASQKARMRLEQLIHWYLFESPYQQRKVVHIIDAYVGMTKSDIKIFSLLRQHGKRIIILANKIDKIKESARAATLQKIQDVVGSCQIIPCSAKKNIGVGVLMNELLMRS
ncbi:YihA family ribosome biogenesis GTP-binding protein [Candidatus Uhrbacteria bacterium]|nr:YihA family ribosome biogenesis GTP-binding protein [Candidatus Uhrbacteria bacterium]